MLVKEATIAKDQIPKKKITNLVNVRNCDKCVWPHERMKDVQTYAELKRDRKASLPDTFSFCFGSMTTHGTNQIFFVLLGKDSNTWLPLGVSKDGNLATRFHHWAELDSEIPLVFANQWVRSCIAINSKSGLVQWVVGGILVENSTVPRIKENMNNRPTDLTGKIVVGVYQDPLSSQWWTIRNQVLANMNIFSRALTINEMIENTKAEHCNVEGDYLAWQDMQWNLHGEAAIESVNLVETCREHPFVNLYVHFSSQPADVFPMNMKSCMHFCENIRSRVPPMTNARQWAKMKTFLAKTFGTEQKANFPPIWLPLVNKDSDGAWKDFYNQEILNFSLPWYDPTNKGSRKNCLQLSFSKGVTEVSDLICGDLNRACICDRQPLPLLRLRGLCSNWVVLDTLFQPRNHLSDFTKLSFVGMKASISFDNNLQVWAMTDTVNNLTGISKASYASFTLGRHNWTIKGDTLCTGGTGSEYTTELKMSGCLKGNFTCDDGQCVSMEQRCDQLPDCRDKSDERNCKILVLEKDYNKNVPPVVSKEDGTKVLIGVSIDLLKLVDIKEENHAIEIQFSITLKWKENRAIYHNLKKEKTLNALTNNDIARLWLPELIYENTDQKETTRLGVQWEWKTLVVVDRQGNFTRSASDIVDEIEIFDGAENNMEMTQTYTHDFQCVFDFKYYPFDTQVNF